jgi:hypothetical protein
MSANSNNNKAYTANQKLQDKKLESLMYLYHHGKLSEINQLVVVTKIRLHGNGS